MILLGVGRNSISHLRTGRRKFVLRVCLLLLLALVANRDTYPGVDRLAEMKTQVSPQQMAEQFMKDGDQLFAIGTPDALVEAIRRFEEALRIFKSLNEQRQQAGALNAIGGTYYILGDNRRANDYFDRALSLFEALGDQNGSADTLNQMGRLFESEGYMQKALDHYEQALKRFKQVKNWLGEATVINNMGAVYRARGDKQALKYYQQALEIARAEKDQFRQAATLNNLGSAYQMLGKPKLALERFNQALALWRTTADLTGQATTLLNIGQLHAAARDKPKALDYYNQALILWRQRADRAGEDRTLGYIRQLELPAEDRISPSLARDYEMRLESARKGREALQEAAALAALAEFYFKVGEYSKALPYYSQAVPLWRTLGKRDRESGALFCLGLCFAALGKQTNARDCYDRVLTLWRASRNVREEARTLQEIGQSYYAAGENRQALEYYEKALQLRPVAGARKERAATLQLIGVVYGDLGERQKALETHTQALELYQAEGDRPGEARTRAYLGAVYASLSDYQQAIESYNQALSLLNLKASDRDEAFTHYLIGETYKDLHEYKKALDAYDRALALWKTLDDRGEEGRTLSRIGAVYTATGDQQKAIDYLTKAIRLLRVERNRSWEASTLRDLGEAYAASGEREKALDYYGQSFLLSNAVGAMSVAAESLFGLARIERDRGDLARARIQIEEALRIVESLRAGVINKGLRATYFASVQDYYEFYIDLLMRLHRFTPSAGYAAAALRASEQARARNLLELLTESRANIRAGVDPVLLDRERAAQQLLNDKANAQISMYNRVYNEQQAAALLKEIQTLSAEYERIVAQIRAKSPRYAALTQPTPLRLNEIQQQLLDPGTMLLEYALGAERSYLWAVTKSSITSYELPKRAEIETIARRFYEYSTVRPQQSDGRRKQGEQLKDAADLSRMLLGQVAGLQEIKRLLIVTDGALQYVPFAALPNPSTLEAGDENGRPLVVAYEIVNLPSASTLAVLRRERASRQLASKMVAVLADPVFEPDDERVKPGEPVSKPKPANPKSERLLKQISKPLTGQPGERRIQRLPFTREEAKQILSLTPVEESQQSLDFQANRITATSADLGHYRYVHFATHGYLDSEQPELSAVVLSLVDEKGAPQDGFLRAHEVYTLNLQAEVVTLSACETGLGKEIKGEGLVGLTRGFMYAGAPRVVVSLWSVSDQATAELMTRFYRGMLKEGLRPAAALRAAQVSLWEEDQWRAPYYWAAFELQGEWR